MPVFQTKFSTIDMPDNLVTIFGGAKVIEKHIVLGRSLDRFKGWSSWDFSRADVSNKIIFCGEAGRLVTWNNKKPDYLFFVIAALLDKKQNYDSRFKNYCELLIENMPCFLENDPDILLAVAHDDITLHFNSDTLAAYLTLLEKPQ